MEREHRLHNKKVVLEYLDFSCQQGAESAAAPGLARYLSPTVEASLSAPHGQQRGREAHWREFWLPLLTAFPDLEPRPYLLLAGEYRGGQYVDCAGSFVGTFVRSWFGIPAHQQPVWLRFHLHCQLAEGKIAALWLFLDTLALIKQAGITLFPQKGVEIVPPAPASGDGIVLYPTEEAEGERTLALVNAMLAGLCSYDGKSLASMHQADFWQIDRMMWYGPSGIGTTRGLRGFEQCHQLPFLTAFPDRGLIDQGQHSTQLAEGKYACDFGFPSMYATHSGDGWLGLPATGKKVTMRVVDIWRRATSAAGERLVENWVMIDMVDLLGQMGVDVFAHAGMPYPAKR